MLKFIKNIKEKITEFDKLTKKNAFMTNPFHQALNQTYVWSEPPREK